MFKKIFPDRLMSESKSDFFGDLQFTYLVQRSLRWVRSLTPPGPVRSSPRRVCSQASLKTSPTSGVIKVVVTVGLGASEPKTE